MAGPLNRLDRGDLVVGVHDRDEHRAVGDRLPDIVGVDTSYIVDLLGNPKERSSGIRNKSA